MKDKHEIYKLNLTFRDTCPEKETLRDIQEQRNKIPQSENIRVELTLRIHGNCGYGGYWHPSKDEKNYCLKLFDEFQCTIICLSRIEVDITPAIKEILTYASQSCKEWRLESKFSDAAFQFVHELMIANGGIQKLEFDDLQLSNTSWDLLNSHKLIGTGDEYSSLVFFNQNKISYEFLAQILVNVSGFKEFGLYYFSRDNSLHHKTFLSLSQVLSKPDCEISKLTICLWRTWGMIQYMMETLTTNKSVTDLTLTCLDEGFTETEITSIMENSHKFNNVRKLSISRYKNNKSLNFLRPLLENATQVKNSSSLEILYLRLHYDKLSEDDYNILLQIAQRYPKLKSIGEYFLLTPAIEDALCRNGRWRHIITRGQEVPLSLWCLVLEDVERKHNPIEAVQQRERDKEEKMEQDKKVNNEGKVNVENEVYNVKDKDVEDAEQKDKKEKANHTEEQELENQENQVDELGWGWGSSLLLLSEEQRVENENYEKKLHDDRKAAFVASIRYEMIQHVASQSR